MIILRPNSRIRLAAISWRTDYIVVEQIFRGNVAESYKTSRTQLDTLWKRIRGHTEGEYMLTLRAAANVVGLWLFPVGWTWAEFQRALELALTELAMPTCVWVSSSLSFLFLLAVQAFTRFVLIRIR